MARKGSPARPDNVVARARAADAGRSPGRPRGALWENVKSILGAIMIYLVLKTFLIEAYRIPSGSMIPTLLIGDWLFVNKLVYGPRIPFTDVRLPGYQEPRRGEVVVFKSPRQIDQPHDPTPTLVKRLVGMPGDTLHMRAGVLHVNGVPRRQGGAAASNWVGEPNEMSELFAWQHRVELRGTRFGAPPAVPTHDNWGPLLIPQRFYFMMGDNRYCSKDSRYWGIVPRENVRGRPMFVYFSYRPNLKPGESLDCNPDVSDRALPFITDVRWGRIGDWVR
ncbi:MAG: signal peptidase I [Gemmatimonadaceae bacterium]